MCKVSFGTNGLVRFNTLIPALTFLQIELMCASQLRCSSSSTPKHLNERKRTIGLLLKITNLLPILFGILYGEPNNINFVLVASCCNWFCKSHLLIFCKSELNKFGNSSQLSDETYICVSSAYRHGVVYVLYNSTDH